MERPAAAISPAALSLSPALAPPPLPLLPSWLSVSHLALTPVLPRRALSPHLLASFSCLVAAPSLSPPRRKPTQATATFVTLNLNGGAALGVRAAFVRPPRAPASAHATHTTRPRPANQVLTVVLTYPLQFFPAMVALEDKLGLSDESGLLPCCAARTCLVLAAFASSLYAPYENLMGLAGGLCAVPLAFIFPGWFHLRLCKPRYGEGRALDITLVAFGVVMAPVAVVSAILSWH